MTRAQRVLWITVGIAAVLVVGAFSAAAMVTVSLHRGGFVRVSVDHRGDDPVSFDLLVPTPFVGGAVSVAGLAMPDEARADLHRQLDEISPLLHAVAAGLEDCPDAVLIEVEDGTDHVRIAKEGGRLIVQVRSEEDDVDVEVPLALFTHTLRSLQV